jgi:hypothetical protein
MPAGNIFDRTRATEPSRIPTASCPVTTPWCLAQARRSPEMHPTNPNYSPHVFYYAAKEHIEIGTDGQISLPTPATPPKRATSPTT